MMEIKAIVFDLDDTLWPLRPLIAAAEKHLYDWLVQQLPSIGERETVESLRARRMELIPQDPRFSYDLWALRHAALTELLVEHQADQALADHGMQVFAHARNQVSLFDEVQESLAFLQQHLPLATISNGFADLKAIGLQSHFQFSLAAHEVGCAKPDRRIFQEALDRLQLPAEQVLYVGDDLRLDVEGAQALGMRAAWMNRYRIDLEETAHAHVKPDLIVHDLHPLKSLVK
ncbi:HAD-IA family hydrolase [Undibacterium cyanobacteriorum]|uniref:HAD-IA family hydrolase n=1 Tax=Undibacterium cyanobacteriorum TaxID=3073561 RepID=A0ABY9RDX2_9BURK|nr:HAD-IA family hydrolase [Undibacterium sp. 20NA77.5]WMW79433.1 HAD-IA family hydrolase [Undibacterium sp. 20NA77.5]